MVFERGEFVRGQLRVANDGPIRADERDAGRHQTSNRVRFRIELRSRRRLPVRQRLGCEARLVHERPLDAIVDDPADRPRDQQSGNAQRDG